MTIRLSKNGKRLGRPPKTEKAVKTFVINSQPTEPSEDFITDDMLECKLVSIPEYSHIPSETQKLGRYAQSTYSLSRYGKNSYVVLAYIDTDIEQHLREGLEHEQIVKRCVNFLNKEQKNKKTSFKPYGNLKLYGYNIINKFGKQIIAVELVTDSRTNEFFWGTGTR